MELVSKEEYDALKKISKKNRSPEQIEKMLAYKKHLNAMRQKAFRDKKREERLIKKNQSEQNKEQQPKTETMEPEQEIIEPEVKNAGKETEQTTQDINKHNPFSGELKRRPYTRPKVDIGNQQDIPEPKFVREQVDLNKDIFSDGEVVEEKSKEGGQAFTANGSNYNENNINSQNDTYQEVANPDLANKSSKEQKKAAKLLADEVIDAYVLLNEAGKMGTKISEDKLLRKSMAGKFQMEVLQIQIPIPDEDGKTQVVAIKTLLDNYNASVDEVFVVTEDFKEEARELLTEMFSEKGWGLSPRQRLLLLFGKDIAMKAITAFSMVKSMNHMLKFGQQALANMTRQQNQVPLYEPDNITNKEGQTVDQKTGQDAPPPPPHTPDAEPDVHTQSEMEEPAFVPKQPSTADSYPAFDTQFVPPSEMVEQQPVVSEEITKEEAKEVNEEQAEKVNEMEFHTPADLSEPEETNEEEENE